MSASTKLELEPFTIHMAAFCHRELPMGPLVPLMVASHPLNVHLVVLVSGSTPAWSEGASWIHSAELRCAVLLSVLVAEKVAPVVTSVIVRAKAFPLTQRTSALIVSPGEMFIDVMVTEPAGYISHHAP